MLAEVPPMPDELLEPEEALTEVVLEVGEAFEPVLVEPPATEVVLEPAPEVGLDVAAVVLVVPWLCSA